MRRADRLFQIVQYLRGGRLVTAASLSDRLEVSERTIYRDMADLIGSGVPIEGEAGVGYVMRQGYDLPPLMFSHDELVALIAGARMVREWGGAAMALAAEEALIKIYAVIPQDAREKASRVEVHARDAGTMTDALRRMIDDFERASENRVRLRFTYADADRAVTERAVRPLGLWFWGKVWTLVAWCELRDDFRMFRLDRISEVTENGTFRAEPDKSLKAFYARQAQHDCLS
ncbi:MAG: YafY family protein [Pseudomonadota bacterium]